MEVTKFKQKTGQGFATITVKLEINSDTIMSCIMDLLERNENITKKSVIENIRTVGSRFVVEGCISFGVNYESKINWDTATDMAKELFPEFFLDYRDYH